MIKLYFVCLSPVAAPVDFDKLDFSLTPTTTMFVATKPRGTGEVSGLQEWPEQDGKGKVANCDHASDGSACELPVQSTAFTIQIKLTTGQKLPIDSTDC